MYTLILWTCATISVAVFGVMIYSIATFPTSSSVAAPATFRHRAVVEIVWAVIPIVIILATAAPAVRALW